MNIFDTTNSLTWQERIVEMTRVLYEDLKNRDYLPFEYEGDDYIGVIELSEREVVVLKDTCRWLKQKQKDGEIVWSACIEDKLSQNEIINMFYENKKHYIDKKHEELKEHYVSQERLSEFYKEYFDQLTPEPKPEI